MPGIAETVNMDHIKNHYYGSHDTINPTGIVPVGSNRAGAKRCRRPPEPLHGFLRPGVT